MIGVTFRRSCWPQMFIGIVRIVTGIRPYLEKVLSFLSMNIFGIFVHIVVFMVAVLTCFLLNTASFTI